MTTESAIIPKEQELDKISSDEIANGIFPRAMMALDQATTVEEINDIRHKILGLGEYLKRRLPSEIQDRIKRLRTANKGNRTYLEACRRAGAAWDLMEKYDGRPPEEESEDQMQLEGIDKSVQIGTLFTAEQAGFTSRQDAHRCAKISRLDPQDWEIYFDETEKAQRQFTLGGLVYAYDTLHPAGKEEQGKKVEFTTGTIRKRIEGIVKKGENLIADMEGDPKKWGEALELVVTGVNFFSDAAEILKEDKT